MITLGLTGSIGMGKTTVAKLFHQLGIPVHEADAVVRSLLASDQRAILAVRGSFPELPWPNLIGHPATVDRDILATHVFADLAALRCLERILHPLVVASQRRFLQLMARRRSRMAVLEAPLLFEIGLDTVCDATAVVTAPSFIQQQRVMARIGMDQQRFGAIQARQLPDRIKRQRADFVIQTNQSIHHTRMVILRITQHLERRHSFRHTGGKNHWGCKKPLYLRS